MKRKCDADKNEEEGEHDAASDEKKKTSRRKACTGKTFSLKVSRMFMMPRMDARGQKKRMNKIFLNAPAAQPMSDEVFHKYQAFVINTMCGCDFEIKCWLRDYLPFTQLVGLSWKGSENQGGLQEVPWKWLHDQHLSKGGQWPVVEERNGKCMMAWFEKGVRKTEWTELTRALVDGEAVPGVGGEAEAEAAEVAKAEAAEAETAKAEAPDL
jgi:hypothetical protein